MIMFEYFCNERQGGCGNVFEELLDKDDRMEPMKKPCPKCKKEGTVCRKYSSKLFHHVINPGKKMNENFKEEMGRIKAEHPEMKSSFV